MCTGLLSANFAKLVSCSSAVGGMNDVLYYFNAIETASLTPGSALGELTDITMVATKVPFTIEVEKDSFIPKQVYDPATKTFKQTADIKLANDTTAERNRVQELVGAKGFIVGRTKNNKWIVIGVDYRGNKTTPASSTATIVGLTMEAMNGSWGPEDFGNAITLSATGVSEMLPYLLDTDYDTTATLLADLLP